MVLQDTVKAAEEYLKEIEEQLESFEALRIKKDTSVGEIKSRFPDVARSVEEEIKFQSWTGPVDKQARDFLQ